MFRTHLQQCTSEYQIREWQLFLGTSVGGRWLSRQVCSTSAAPFSRNQCPLERPLPKQASTDRIPKKVIVILRTRNRQRVGELSIVMLTNAASKACLSVSRWRDLARNLASAISFSTCFLKAAECWPLANWLFSSRMLVRVPPVCNIKTWREIRIDTKNTN